MIHSIPVFTYNKNNEQQRIQLVFDSKEDKINYIKKEAKFCSKERADYMDITNPQSKRELFLAKRLAYAVNSGFKPKGRNKKVWTIQKTKTENEYA